MERTPEQLEALWNNLLSRQPELIREAFNSLDSSTQEIVLAHLKNMAGDPGWQTEQIISAKVALHALEGQIDQEK
jgi:hypothetical protein